MGLRLVGTEEKSDANENLSRLVSMIAETNLNVLDRVLFIVKTYENPYAALSYMQPKCSAMMKALEIVREEVDMFY